MQKKNAQTPESTSMNWPHWWYRRSAPFWPNVSSCLAIKDGLGKLSHEHGRQMWDRVILKPCGKKTITEAWPRINTKYPVSVHWCGNTAWVSWCQGSSSLSVNMKHIWSTSNISYKKYFYRHRPTWRKLPDHRQLDYVTCLADLISIYGVLHNQFPQ